MGAGLVLLEIVHCLPPPPVLLAHWSVAQLHLHGLVVRVLPCKGPVQGPCHPDLVLARFQYCVIRYMSRKYVNRSTVDPNPTLLLHNRIVTERGIGMVVNMYTLSCFRGGSDDESSVERREEDISMASLS